MEKLINLLLILWAAACVCAGKETHEEELRISFGKTATEGQFPYQAIIYYNGRLHCGASIIHERWLLTAAHCKVSENVADFYVRVGTIYRNKMDGQRISIEKFIKHEEFDMTKMVDVGSAKLWDSSNDIALIRLSNDVNINEFVKLITLDRNDTNQYENVTTVVSGLGRTQTVPIVVRPEELQYIQVKVISDAECKKAWAALPKVILRHTICTSVMNKTGTCRGDSGGPLVYRDEQHQDKQIGIVSLGDPFYLELVPNVYTRVSSFIPWINQQLKSYSDVLPE